LVHLRRAGDGGYFIFVHRVMVWVIFRNKCVAVL
jgi:hypothetical protein